MNANAELRERNASRRSLSSRHIVKLVWAMTSLSGSRHHVDAADVVVVALGQDHGSHRRRVDGVVGPAVQRTLEPHAGVHRSTRPVVGAEAGSCSTTRSTA